MKLLAINEGQAVAQMFAHHFLLDLDRDSTALSSQVCFINKLYRF